MGFLSSLLSPSPSPGFAIKGRVVYLRPPAREDFAEWRALRLESRPFLEPWEATWMPDDHERRTFMQRVTRYEELRDADSLYAMFVFRGSDQVLLGGITLSNVRRGIADAGTFGYWIGARYANQGYMTDAVEAMLSYAFNDLALHRIEAACLPGNTPSRKLLERCGFAQEGYARDYLKIAGQWEDHVLFARVNDVNS